MQVSKRQPPADLPEAAAVLAAHVLELRRRPFDDFRVMAGGAGWGFSGFRISFGSTGRPEDVQVAGPSGRLYDVRTEALWDEGHERGPIRVVVEVQEVEPPFGHIQDDPFIMAPDGHFVGE